MYSLLKHAAPNDVSHRLMSLSSHNVVIVFVPTKTVVTKPARYRLDNIDSPVWLAIPPATWSFTGQDKLTVLCKVAVPNERKVGFNNELKLLRLEKVTARFKNKRSNSISQG